MGKSGGKKETLGQRLQRLRRVAKLTQEKLAEQSGQSFGNLKNWERDYRTPGLWAALQLARALGVPLEDLAVCAEPDPKAKADEEKRSKRRRQVGGRPVGRPKRDENPESPLHATVQKPSRRFSPKR